MTCAVGFFRHRQLDLPIDFVKNTKEEKHLSGQEHQCDASQKPSDVRISIIVLRKAENTCEQCFLMVIRSKPLSRWRRNNINTW